MSYTFNLIDKNWIPCVTLDGRTCELSLREVFARAHELLEVRDTSPLVTASIYRFLLAILHRNFGPSNSNEWLDLWQLGHFEMASLDEYLAKWYDRFDLFHPSRPFYQAGWFKAKKESPITRLVFETASGNNPTLFDHTTEHEPRALTASESARALICHQAFAIGGGRSDTGYTSHGPLVGGIIVLLRGTNLFETLLLNLVQYAPGSDHPFPGTVADVPTWERDEEVKPVKRKCEGYLDLLTWQSRLIHLLPDGDPENPVVDRVYYGQGETLHGNLPFDPQIPYTNRNEKTGWVRIKLSPDRVLWRDSTAMINLSSQQKDRPPEACRWISTLVTKGVLDKHLLYHLATFGLASDRAKLLLWRAETMPIPLSYLVDEELVNQLQDCLAWSEQIGRYLEQALYELAKQLLCPDDGRKPDQDLIRSLVNSWDAMGQYWSRLERPFYRLVRDLPTRGDKEAARWKSTVQDEAFECLTRVCNGLESSGRSLRAQTQSMHAFRNRIWKARKEV